MSQPLDIPPAPGGSAIPLTSPPINPSKLNQAPAPLPDSAATTTGNPTSPPLRSPESATLDSAYLDTGVPEEPSSHPTIAETGEMAKPQQAGPGPMTGQLERVEKDPQRRIVRLGSLGGEGLIAKPPAPLPGDEEEVGGSAIVDEKEGA